MGVGGGIAIPHGVHNDLTRTIALLAVLKAPVDFDAMDGQPVDIICLVVGPPNDDTNNLKCIASVTRSLQQASTCDKLRSVKSPEAVLRCLQDPKALLPDLTNLHSVLSPSGQLAWRSLLMLFVQALLRVILEEIWWISGIEPLTSQCHCSALPAEL